MRIFRKSLKKATEEEKLLLKVHKGDKAAQELLYRQHVRYLAALSSRYVANDDDAKDVLQESFIKIFSSINTFEYRGEGSLRAWMARITLNEALAFIRDRNRGNSYGCYLSVYPRTSGWLSSSVQPLCHRR